MFLDMRVTTVPNYDEVMVHYPTASDFTLQYESQQIPDSILDGHLYQISYKGTDRELVMDKESLKEAGIDTPHAFYHWISSEKCDWFN